MPFGRAFPFPVAVLFLGCHSYIPTTVDAAPLGSEMRVLLSTEAQVRLQDRLGMETQRLTGQLLAKARDTLLLRVRTAGVGSRSLFQNVDLARRDVLRLELKEDHQVRTAGLIVALVGGATMLTILMTRDVESGGSPVAPVTPTERLVRWLIEWRPENP